jgi:pyruvate dehydrogenase E2 component (dihydrolipoamide acetyltransferase)
MSDFIMPSLGADMESATLMKWLVSEGGAVKRGDVMAEVETDKGLIEIECFETGIVEKLVAEIGAKIPVGGVIAVIRTTGAPVTEKPAAKTSEPSVPPVPHVSPLARKIAAELGVDVTKLTGTGPGGIITREDVEQAGAAPVVSPPKEESRIRISPLARKLASEKGIDLSAIKGTGPAGAIESADIERATVSGKGSDGMRRAIAAAMAKSNREIPHYYLQSRIDMSRTLAWLEERNRERSIQDRLLIVVPLLKAVAKALREVPGLNGFWIDDGHRISEAIHLGFAISMKGGGLVTPAIHDVDRLTCEEIMAALRDLIPRARAGRLRGSEMTDATLTVTSLGDLGVESVFGVIYPPQVGLVGFGKILEQPWAQDGMLGVRPVMTASLAADHRATDGHVGAQFLDALNRHFQAPESL